MSVRPTRELVLKKLRDCFTDAQQANDALTIIDNYGADPKQQPERERVQLAMLMCSRGDLDRLLQLAVSAERDYRDVLVAAEYPGQTDAPSKTSKEEMEAICQRDRARYGAWLDSNAGL